jgi:hypothetical protein
MIKKLRAPDVELAVARFFNYRINLIVPNIYWGFDLNYEADLLIISPAAFATEIEIKVTNSDIKRDSLKSAAAHKSNRIKKFFYAVPDYLAGSEYLPKDAGLIAVDKNKNCRILRPPRINKIARKLRHDEIETLMKLAAMRIWGLKEHINNLKKRDQ